jgi:hypothetical protein
MDLSLSRTFDEPERTRVEFRSEFFNALNHTNLATPNRFVNTPPIRNHHGGGNARPRDPVERQNLVLIRRSNRFPRPRRSPSLGF